MTRLIPAITRTLDIDAALTEVYGLDQHGLDSAWRQEIGLEPLPRPEEGNRHALLENIPDATVAPVLMPTFPPLEPAVAGAGAAPVEPALAAASQAPLRRGRRPLPPPIVRPRRLPNLRLSYSRKPRPKPRPRYRQRTRRRFRHHREARRWSHPAPVRPRRAGAVLRRRRESSPGSWGCCCYWPCRRGWLPCGGGGSRPRSTGAGP